MYSVSVRHLTKIFRTDRGTVTATDDLSLTFPAGEITAVVGESGCGKTTLLRLIAGLETAYEGCVVTEATGNSAAPCETAVVFQEPRLFPWLSVADNLKLAVRQLPADEQDRRLADALSLTGLTEAADAYPTELSGGMAQRAGFARALIAEPDVLLLDEAFSALDALTRDRVRSEFLKIHARRPMTTILVTHDILEACLLAHRIIRLKNGRTAAVYAVEAPYPRTLADSTIGQLADTIRNDFFN